MANTQGERKFIRQQEKCYLAQKKEHITQSKRFEV